jgi:hypothetical protein
MKNKFYLVVLVLVFGLSFIGCVSTRAYDTSLPETNQCTLIVAGNTGHGISSFDGEDVNWKPPFAIFPQMASCKVTIPAGKHTLSNGIFPTIEYDFVAGKTYRVSAPFGQPRLEIKEEG